jgi:hypothetical protein
MICRETLTVSDYKTATTDTGDTVWVLKHLECKECGRKYEIFEKYVLNPSSTVIDEIANPRSE